MKRPQTPQLAGPNAERWQLEARAGEGASAVVWRAREKTTGAEVALKIARSAATSIRDAEVIARVGRRWGPALVDAGRLASGEAFVATEWAQGEALDPKHVPARSREKVAAIVAHAVGRALGELHASGVRHGDVKPANVIVHTKAPKRDAAEDRGASLIDLGLADAIENTEATGGSLHYLAPEIRAGGVAGPEADAYALGVMLAEVLAGHGAKSSEPAKWADALVATSPGARPSVEWVAERAARWLGLHADACEGEEAREARVRRTYLAVRAREISGEATVAAAIDGVARAWLKEAIGWSAKIGEAREARAIAPMTAMDRRRWLVALVGPAAAAWPIDEDAASEGAIAARFVTLARACEPAAWTMDAAFGRGEAASAPWTEGESHERVERVARIACELGRAVPDVRAIEAAEDEVARGEAPAVIAIELARALVRRGETGRAWAAIAGVPSAAADALRAEIARRRGDRAGAEEAAKRAAKSDDRAASDRARATLARLAWDVGDLDAADRALDGAFGAAAVEMRALCMFTRGAFDAGTRAAREALVVVHDAEASARLEATVGLLEHARGRPEESLAAFSRAVELATRAGAVVEEATYLTGESAAAADAGETARALASATRAALLWERLGRGRDAARAWLTRASALGAVGATHAADEAAAFAMRLAGEARDMRCAAFARWAIVETRAPGDARAREEAVRADAELATSSEDDRARAAARVLVWAPEAIDDARIASLDLAMAGATASAQWEWWGARARAWVAGRRASGDDAILSSLSALVDVPAPLGSRGPALGAAMDLATERGDGDAARRFETSRRAAAMVLREGAPETHRASIAGVAWARMAAAESVDVALAPAQIAQLEAITRALAGSRDALKPLLEQILDAMVLWTGVERGLLLLCAPNGRLVPRSARNLARHDLRGEQLALSQTIARRALETGDAVVATDAYASLGDLHASVHALRLRSVLAVPLVARGVALGVVYLDDRARRGAFGPRELAWVRLVASQAASALADARDHALLRRAVRRTERARARVESLLHEREAELDVARSDLRARAGDETRFEYGAIIGRSEPMRVLLKLVDRVTASDVPVLIGGESGTGKELVARAIHVNGPRGRRAFVSENCASVPEPLLESTLFGHVRGAFTGAQSTRAGLFDVADGGSLFLDEIGEMSLGMQSKLLRVLQDGEVRAVGGERTRRVDVRVLAATNRDLSAMVARGQFREDLFYRLDVISVRVPALRERPDDVPLLVAHFLEKHAPAEKRGIKVTRGAMDRLASYPWPGNVRQLENELRRAIVLADDRIDVTELSADVARGGPSASRAAGLDLRARLDALEAELVREALDKTRGNQTRAAEVLGISRFGLQKMMKRLGVNLTPPR